MPKTIPAVTMRVGPVRPRTADREMHAEAVSLQICYNNHEDITKQAALHVTATVQPGKKLEIPTPELTEGDTAEVFVVASKPTAATRRLNARFPKAAGHWSAFRSYTGRVRAPVPRGAE